MHNCTPCTLQWVGAVHTLQAQRAAGGGCLQAHTSFCPHQVVGVKDSLMGEEVCACIRLRAGQSCAADDIKAFCKGKVCLPLLCAQLPVSCLATTTSSSWGAAKAVM